MGAFGGETLILDEYASLLAPLGIEQVSRCDVLQTLWGGYGELVRLSIRGAHGPSVIVKHIRLPKPTCHPRGWNTDRAHQRKLSSYQVECRWYQDYAGQCLSHTPVPRPLQIEWQDQEMLLVIEDLRTLGYTKVSQQATPTQIQSVLRWLAWFHASHIGSPADGLWDNGTYWHLATRPDELAALDDSRLKRAAAKLDRLLSEAPYQTLVHGDAKLANFCFRADDRGAAAVDFQYVGRGCAMKDVALFISSAVEPAQCAELESALLDRYFRYLTQALQHCRPELSAHQVERAWRPLFALAWADFQRFIKGWSPGHWKINPYTEALTERALDVVEAHRG